MSKAFELSEGLKKDLVSRMKKDGFQATFNKYKNRDAKSFDNDKDEASGSAFKKAVLEFITRKGPAYRTKGEQKQEAGRIRSSQTKDYQKGRGAPYAGGKRVKISQEDIDLAEEKGRIVQRQEAAARIGGSKPLSDMEKESMKGYGNVDSLEPSWLFGRDLDATDVAVGGGLAAYPAYQAGKYLLPKSLRAAGKIAKAVGGVRVTTKARQEAAKRTLKGQMQRERLRRRPKDIVKAVHSPIRSRR